VSASLHIYCANLHVGGIVVTAASFLDTLPQLIDEGSLSSFSSLLVTASTTVAKNMQSINTKVDRPFQLDIRDDSPASAPLRRHKRVDVRVIISGPDYAIGHASIQLCGFHDANILGPRAESFYNSSFRLGIKRTIQREILKRYDAYFTETEPMAQSLSDFQPGKEVAVIQNAPAEVFTNQMGGSSSKLPFLPSHVIRLFFPARGYPHKNHSILPDVINQFNCEGDLELQTVTTLREDEIDSLGLRGCSGIINVGEVGVDELPSLYSETHGVIFPSLNELSSVTPIEGMIMRRPVFASDRHFVRETCRDHVNYIDPLDPADIANTIKIYFSKSIGASLEGAFTFAHSLPTPIERARMLMEFVNRVLQGGSNENR